MKTSLHNNMKKLFVLGMLVIMVMTCPQHTYAQNVGINNASPDVSAALDVKSGSGLNQGILPTFVDLATATFPSPGPANGLFVHNSNSAYGQGTGIYQNVGTAAAPIWLKQLTRNDAWYLFGNRITSAGIPATYGTSKIPSGNWLGAANAADLVFGTDSIERARIFSSGQFSIGSSSAGAKLDIHQTTSTPTLRLYNYGNVNEMEFRRSSGTQAAQTATGAGSIVGRLLGVGYDGSGYNNRTIAGISFETETATTSTNSSGRIVFTTTTTGSTSGVGGTERMRIDNTGNVGIGNSNPTEKLVVSGNEQLDGALKGTVRYYTSSNTTTSFTTDANYLILSGVSPGATTGTYLVTFSWNGTDNNFSDIMNVEYEYNNGTSTFDVTTNPYYQYIYTSNQASYGSYQAVITIPASTTYSFRIKVYGASTYNTTLYGGTISAIRIN